MNYYIKNNFITNDLSVANQSSEKMFELNSEENSELLKKIYDFNLQFNIKLDINGELFDIEHESIESIE